MNPAYFRPPDHYCVHRIGNPETTCRWRAKHNSLNRTAISHSVALVDKRARAFCCPRAADFAEIATAEHRSAMPQRTCTAEQPCCSGENNVQLFRDVRRTFSNTDLSEQDSECAIELPIGQIASSAVEDAWTSPERARDHRLHRSS